jgi:NADH:ubiquinone oxidoreductase subunit 4 (subunit M)
MRNLDIREWFILTPLIILIFSIGIYPNFIFKFLQKPSENIINVIKKGGEK